MEDDQLGLLFEALKYASEKHAGQLRKGDGNIPYINHPIALLHILYETGCQDYDILIAAVLHDIIEDTHVSISELSALFGGSVTSLVAEISDDMSLTYEERKQAQKDNAELLSDGAKQIRIADKICNVRDITNPLLDWDNAARFRYINWADEVVEGCRGVNPVLDAVFEETITKAKWVLTDKEEDNVL